MKLTTMGSSKTRASEMTERWVSQDSVQQDDRVLRVFLVDSSEASVDHRHEPVLKTLHAFVSSGVLYMFGTLRICSSKRRRRTTIGEHDRWSP
jgi:hypothetical protein